MINIEKKSKITEPTPEADKEYEILARISLVEKDIAEFRDSPEFKLLKPLDVYFEQEKNLIEAMATLVLRLESKLIEYDTVIGDDVSGRLMAMFLRRVIKNLKVDKKSPNTFFVAAGRLKSDASKSKIENFFETKKESLGKVLLVTEYISSGKGINLLLEIIENVGIDFDLSALSICYNLDYYQQEFPLISKRLFYGCIGQTGFYFYNRKYLTGVKKDADKEHSIRDTEPHTYATDSLQQDRKDIRKCLNSLADFICEKILKKEN